MSRAAVLLFLAACSGGKGEATAVPAGTPGGTVSGTPSGTTPSGTVLTTPHVRCDIRPDNVLIADCTALLPSTGTAAAFLESPDGSLRALEAVQTGDALAFTVWRLLAQTTYTVRVQPASGLELSTDLTTGQIPAAHAVAPQITGTPSFSHLLVPHMCDGGPNMLLLDDQGRIVWYLEAASGVTGATFTAVDGFDVTPDGIAALVGRTRLRRWTWDQQMLTDLVWPTALSGPVHHDVFYADDHLYVLTAEQVTGLDGLSYVMDGFLVYDAQDQLVAEWSLHDVYEPTGGIVAPGGFWATIFPNAWDWAHSNGLHVDDNGDVLLSSRTFDTVLKVRADWTEPDFGQVAWGLSADPYSPLGSDFSVGGAILPTDFQDQHHPNLDSIGRLLLFDNRGFGWDSRAVRYDVDESTMSATLTSAWSLGEFCSVQGSAFPLSNDHVVATCASSRTTYEFSPTQPDPVWTMTLPCAVSPNMPLMVRGYPLDF